MKYDHDPVHMPRHIDKSGDFKPSKRNRPTSEMEKVSGNTDMNTSNFVNPGIGKLGATPGKDPLDGTAKKATPPKIKTDLDFNSQNKM